MRENGKKFQFVAAANLQRGEIHDPAELIELTLVGDLESFKNYLVNHPEVINIKETTNGNVALHVASSRGNPSMVSLLLSKGANPDIQDIFGNTALHYAADKRHLHVAEVLINHRADVNKADFRGNTPLHVACSHNNSALVKLLLLHNANPEVSDLANLRPIDKATVPAVKQLIERKIQAINGAENEGTQQTMQWMSLGIGLGVGLGMAMAKQQQFFLEQQIRIMQMQNQSDRRKKFVGVQHSTSQQIENNNGLYQSASVLVPVQGSAQQAHNISFNPGQMTAESTDSNRFAANSSSRKIL